MKEYDWDFPGAGRAYQRALELNPNNAIAYQWYGEYLAARGQHPQAIAAIQRGIELDPLSLISHATLGRHGYYFARQYDQAIAQLHKTLEMDGNFWVAHYFLGWVYARTGRLTEALTAFQTAQRLDGNLEIVAGLAYAHARKDASGAPVSIVHRDVSPQNIIVSFEGDVKLIDFGIAKAAGKLVRTQVGSIKGKFGYMSTEQLTLAEIDQRAACRNGRAGGAERR